MPYATPTRSEFKAHRKSLVRLTQLRRTRLFGAWGYSMLARCVSLIPLALFAAHESSGASHAGRLYISAFAIVASLSYVLNSLNEAQLFTKEPRRATSWGLLVQCICCLVAGSLLLAPLVKGALWTDDLVMVAFAVQPLVARTRTQLVDTTRYRGAYSSTALRDSPSAVVAVYALTHDSATGWLPFALVFGCMFQWLYLFHRQPARWKRGKPSGHTTLVSNSRNAMWVLLGAVSLAAFQPLARFFVQFGRQELGLAAYELADRPAYIVALTIAGGVGTELQRRWRDASLGEAREEIRRARYLVTILMTLGLVATWITASLLRSHLPIVESGHLLALLPITFASNLLYLFCILHTRLLIANGRPQQATTAYAAGLVSMGATCAGSYLIFGPYNTVVVALASVGGFIVAFTLLKRSATTLNTVDRR